MSGRSRRPGSNLRALPWRTALLAGLVVWLVAWELETPQQATAGPTPATTGSLAADAQAPADGGVPSTPAGPLIGPSGTPGATLPGVTPAEVLAAGPGAAAPIGAAPVSFSDPTR